jgi:hypothetical protein
MWPWARHSVDRKDPVIGRSSAFFEATPSNGFLLKVRFLREGTEARGESASNATIGTKALGLTGTTIPPWSHCRSRYCSCCAAGLSSWHGSGTSVSSTGITRGALAKKRRGASARGQFPLPPEPNCWMCLMSTVPPRTRRRMPKSLGICSVVLPSQSRSAVLLGRLARLDCRKTRGFDFREASQWDSVQNIAPFGPNNR